MTPSTPVYGNIRFRALQVSAFLLLLISNATVNAQDRSLEDLLPALQDRAVVMDIVARVLEPNKQVVWNQTNTRVTIPGRPVGLKLLGTNVVVAVQFTPYKWRDGRNVLVAQGQIWVDEPNKGISYRTTMETIPLEYGEPVYFFPFGETIFSEETGEDKRPAYIEIQVVLRPYNPEKHGPEGQAEVLPVQGVSQPKSVIGSQGTETPK
ncbi:MAG: hypothetical protein LBT16_03790 [Treponema sp.]|jgi:hypothetical protein|nr:hypothetical protein [Treponema sp.]